MTPQKWKFEAPQRCLRAIFWPSSFRTSAHGRFLRYMSPYCVPSARPQGVAAIHSSALKEEAPQGIDTEAKDVGLDVSGDAWAILATAGADHLGPYMFVAGDGMKKRRSVGNKHVGSSLNEFLRKRVFWKRPALSRSRKWSHGRSNRLSLKATSQRWRWPSGYVTAAWP